MREVSIRKTLFLLIFGVSFLLVCLILTLTKKDSFASSDALLIVKINNLAEELAAKQQSNVSAEDFYLLSQSYCLTGDSKVKDYLLASRQVFKSRFEQGLGTNYNSTLLLDNKGQISSIETSFYLLGELELKQASCTGQIGIESKELIPLADGIVFLQKQDNFFKVSFEDSSESDLGNGVDFLSLVQASEVLGKKEYIESVAQASAVMSKKYDNLNEPSGFLSKDKSDFYNYGVQGYELLDLKAQNTEYEQYILNTTDQTNGEAKFIFGIMSGVRVAKKTGDQDRFNKYSSWVEQLAQPQNSLSSMLALYSLRSL